MATYKIIKIERKELKDGRKIAKVTLRDTVDSIETENVTIWPDYPNFEALDEGYTTEGDLVVKVNGDFKNTSLYPARTKTLGNRGGGNAAGIKKAQEFKQEGIKEAQATRQEGVKLAGTARDATLLTVEWLRRENTHNLPVSDEEVRIKWLEWRKWLEENHGDGQPF